MRLRVVHHTVYRYGNPVSFGPHRLLVVPRESRHLRVASFQIDLSPRHRLRSYEDVNGNTVLTAVFDEPSAELRAEVRILAETALENPFDFILDRDAVHYPFAYGHPEWPVLAPYAAALFPAGAPAPDRWIEWVGLAARPGERKPVVEMLTALNERIRGDFFYRRRDEEGVQTPLQTLEWGSGSCRDFALLFMETCRSLGLAARFVSGYAHQPKSSRAEHGYAEGSTHAWAEVYLPGAGWKGFDPTAGVLACDWHIPVAVSAVTDGTTPVSGTFGGGNYLGMEVVVKVSDENEPGS